MSIDQLAPRILNLPADVRAALARVDGPGWRVSNFSQNPVTAQTRCENTAWTWWPANPAQAVAAVTGCDMFRAHARIVNQINVSEVDDDLVAAISIIEAHCAGRSPNA